MINKYMSTTSEVLDLLTKDRITRPIKNPLFKFHLDYLDKGRWYYINSADIIEHRRFVDTIDFLNRSKKSWRIIDVISNKIVRQYNGGSQSCDV